MPKLRESDSSPTVTISLRIDQGLNLHLRRQAKLKGQSISEYTKNLLYHGAIAQNFDELEARLQGVISNSLLSQITPGRPGLSENAFSAIFTTEEALKELLHQRDPQAWYRVQEKARQRAREELGNGTE